jgi:hypothetical protein
MTDLDFQEIIERWDAIERGETFQISRNGRPVAIFERYLGLDVTEAPSQID